MLKKFLLLLVGFANISLVQCKSKTLVDAQNILKQAFEQQKPLQEKYLQKIIQDKIDRHLKDDLEALRTMLLDYQKKLAEEKSKLGSLKVLRGMHKTMTTIGNICLIPGYIAGFYTLFGTGIITVEKWHEALARDYKVSQDLIDEAMEVLGKAIPVTIVSLYFGLIFKGASKLCSLAYEKVVHLNQVNEAIDRLLIQFDNIIVPGKL